VGGITGRGSISERRSIKGYGQANSTAT